MSFILTLIGAMLALDAIWLAVSLRIAPSPMWRVITGIFMAAQITGFVWLIGGRLLNSGADRLLPKFASSALFIWHFFGLTLLLLAAALILPILLVQQASKWFGKRAGSPPPLQAEGAWTRRDFLKLTAVAAPPLFTLGLTGVALAQLTHFRIRRFVLPIPGLPPALDGLTLAHVSDIHVGRFTSGRVLQEIVAATNELDADLVLLTGDLINDSLRDLPAALDAVHSMRSRHGCWSIEGNHDLIENPREFERRVKASGIPFLLGESTVLQIRGLTVQLLGLRWTRTHSENRDEAIASAVRSLLTQQRADAFPILLAHHPHAFDAAAEAGIPLTLAGHTHGGQLMLNEQLGFGPAMFRYWSGIYSRGPSRLVVSNGVGNWFPIRTNAPAEIVHITLQRADV